MLSIPERASATAASLWGRVLVNEGRGGEGVKVRKPWARDKNLVITITRNQSRMVCKTWKGNVIIAVGR
jgi:hypothetical protein